MRGIGRWKTWLTLDNLLIATGALVLVFLGSLAHASAEPLPAGAGRFVERLADEARAILDRPDFSDGARDARFRSLFTENVDFPVIGRFVLGRHWREATAEEQGEFLALFEELTVRTYTERLGQYSGETFRVDEVRNGATGDALVRSRIVRPDDGPPVRLDWRVRGPEEGYKVVDIALEGVSMSLTQRSQFASVLRQNGGRLGELIEALRKKVAFLKGKG